MIIRNEMLSYGSSKPQKSILDDIVGKELDPDYFIQTVIPLKIKQ
jgi:Zn-dependent M32 family carboxypeptidase